MSICLCVCVCVSPSHAILVRPLIGPHIVAGSTRQQTVGRINQVANYGDGHEDEDKDEDKITSHAVLLTTSVKRFDDSHMRDLCNMILNPECIGFEGR